MVSQCGRGGPLSTPLVKPPNIGFLIQHLKREDIHLYEALGELERSIKDTIREAVPFVGADFQEIGFNFAIGAANLAVGTNVPPPRVVTNKNNDGTMRFWLVRAGVVPTGADIVIKIFKNSLAHVTLTIPAGFGGTIVETNIQNSSVKYLDVYTADVVQVGSLIPGRKIFAVGYYNFS